jgi:hypothetical protein
MLRNKDQNLNIVYLDTSFFITSTEFFPVLSEIIISPITGPEGPRGFQEVKVPRFRDNGTGWW